MKQFVFENIPAGSIFFCAFLAWAIPFTINRINRKLHQYIDPPWKQKDGKKTN